MKPISTVYTTSAEETEHVGIDLAQAILSDPSLPHFVALYGDLGVGKTAFVRGFASVIAPNSAVRSPTFAIVNEYRSSSLSVFHFDMYRIDSEDDLLSIGFDDYLSRRGICLTEWSEKIEDALPENRISVLIEKNDSKHPSSRKITLQLIEEGCV